jgi:hypothetical protein
VARTPAAFGFSKPGHPSTEGGVGGKMGLDATVPPGFAEDAIHPDRAPGAEHLKTAN